MTVTVTSGDGDADGHTATRRLTGPETDEVARIMDHPWTHGCTCSRCEIIGAMVWSEAVASVRMSRDPDVQTVTLGEDGRW